MMTARSRSASYYACGGRERWRWGRWQMGGT